MSYCELITNNQKKPRFKFSVKFSLENEEKALKLAKWLKENRDNCMKNTGIGYWIKDLADIIENK